LSGSPLAEVDAC